MENETVVIIKRSREKLGDIPASINETIRTRKEYGYEDELGGLIGESAICCGLDEPLRALAHAVFYATDQVMHQQARASRNAKIGETEEAFRKAAMDLCYAHADQDKLDREIIEGRAASGA